MTALLLRPSGITSLLTGNTDQLSTTGAQQGDFLSTISHALGVVSQDQAAATGAENAVATGKPGASVASALVLSDRAELGWNAVVAVRNEVVSAYQGIMNMQI